MAEKKTVGESCSLSITSPNDQEVVLHIGDVKYTISKGNWSYAISHHGEAVNATVSAAKRDA